MAKHFRATLILPKFDFYCSRAAPPTLANVPWYREDNPPAIRFLADNSKLSLHGIQIGNPFMRKYRADTCERCYCRNIEKESNNDTSITRGNIIYYFSTVGRISSSKLRKPILSPLLFLSNSFIEQFPFLLSFFFFQDIESRKKDSLSFIPIIIRQYDR